MQLHLFKEARVVPCAPDTNGQDFWDEVGRRCEKWQHWKWLPVKYPSFPSFTALIWILKTVQLFAISMLFSLSFSHAVGGQAVPPTLWEDKPAQWWMLAELHKALYCIPSHPTPSSRVLPSKEDAVGVPCPRGDTRKSQQCRARKVPGCPCTLWLLFASSGLNSCWDLGGPGYKIMDPMPFRLHRAGGKAATWSECCWLWICPAFGLFSVGLKVMLFCYH